MTTLAHTRTTTVDPILLNPRDAAAALAISTRTLWNLTRAGLIPAVKIGRAVRYSPESLEAFVRARTGAGQ